MIDNTGEMSETVTVPKALMESLEFFRLQPTLDQVAEHIVLKVMRDEHAVAAVIGRLTGEATISLVGTFGLSAASLDGLACSAIRHESPLCDAVCTGEFVERHSADEMRRAYPSMPDLGPSISALVSLPLSLPQGHMGALTVFFGSDADLDRAAAALELFGQGLSLYLALMSVGVTRAPQLNPHPDVDGHGRLGASGLNGHVQDGRPFSMNDWNDMQPMIPPSSRQPSTVTKLTARQLGILRLMAEDMTNSQIAMRIGYSESTVRQETMAIYRFLGIHERHEAVRAALASGLIERASQMSEH